MTIYDEITYEQALARVAAEMQGPLAMDEFVRRVLLLRPSTAKNPKTAVLNKLRDILPPPVVKLDHATVIPSRLVMEGVRFAVPLTRQEISRGVVQVFPTLQGLVSPYGDPLPEIALLDDRGNPLSMQLVMLKETRSGPFGKYEIEHPCFAVQQWLKKCNAKRDDYVIFTIVQWQPLRLQLAYESQQHRRRQHDEVAVYNRELTDALYAQLEAARNEEIWAGVALIQAYALMRDPKSCPGDIWMSVVESDERMYTDGIAIHYGDWQSPLMSLLEKASGVEPNSSEPRLPVSPEAARQVYVFKAALTHRKDLWRRIEIQGGQDLADFDRGLRDAFHHDMMDHLGGFWKQVRRGNSRRYREVEIGTINPFAGGDAADIQVAALNLQPGDSLKYVYDFGDWIEHVLTLEAITEPESGAAYPRVTAQNRPQYHYCESCQAKGKQVVATWICIECSNAMGRDVLLCEDCLMRKHPDHYADELLY